MSYVTTANNLPPGFLEMMDWFVAIATSRAWPPMIRDEETDAQTSPTAPVGVRTGRRRPSARAFWARCGPLRRVQA